MQSLATYFHFLFEAGDVSVTAETLGSDEIIVRPHYSWTPLDYYVTGHAISHSNRPWKLNFGHSSIDNDKFELFKDVLPLGELDTGVTSHMPSSVKMTLPPSAYNHF